MRQTPPATMSGDAKALRDERDQLEQRELELSCAADGGDSAELGQVYLRLLLVYLTQGEKELPNAKYLWKRIPPEIKASHPNLAQAWKVGQGLIRGGQHEQVYQALAGEWSPGLESYVQRLKDSIRARHVRLVSHTYTSISLSHFAEHVGLPDSEALELAKQQSGWVVEDQAAGQLQQRHILPKPIKTSPEADDAAALGAAAKAAMCEQKIGQLTNFVSFLEKA